MSVFPDFLSLRCSQSSSRTTTAVAENEDDGKEENVKKEKPKLSKLCVGAARVPHAFPTLKTNGRPFQCVVSNTNSLAPAQSLNSAEQSKGDRTTKIQYTKLTAKKKLNMIFQVKDVKIF